MISKSLFADNDERPDCCTTEEWKNRFRISAKLGQINYRSALSFSPVTAGHGHQESTT